jgi:hypothetical protein
MSIVEIAFKFCELVISGLSVLLSWPVAVCGIAIFFMIKFRKAIDAILQERNIRLKGLGGAIDIQKPLATDDKPLPDDIDKLQIKHKKAIAMLETYREHKDLSEKHAEKLRKQSKALQKQFQEAVVIAKLWEAKYLDLFLSPITKDVLQWFSRSDVKMLTDARKVTRGIFHDVWFDAGTESERNRILEALIRTKMIVEQDGYLAITGKGREYVKNQLKAPWF